MEIILNHISLDLPRDISLSVQRQSPFFQQEGSYTLPLTLPDTAHNRQALNFPNRLDSAWDADGSQAITSALLINGAMQQQCTLTLLSYTPGTGFEVSLILNESCISLQLQDVTLKQVLQNHYYDAPTRTVKKAAPGITPTTPDDTIEVLDERAQRTTESSAGSLTEEVRARLFTDYSRSLHDDFEVATVITPRGVINEPIPPLPSSGEAYTEMLIDGEKQAGPEGIGHTVFLHLDYVLAACFNYIGRSLTIEFPDEGPLTQDIFRHILILNQTIDALVPGRIYFDTLVPDTPVSDLLQAMFALFGATFQEKEDGSVRMIFMQSVLSDADHLGTQVSTPANDNNPVLQSISYREPAALEIQPEHIRHDDDSETKTAEELSRYGRISSDGIKYFDLFGSTSDGGIIQNADDDDIQIGDLGVCPVDDNIGVAQEDEYGNLVSKYICHNQTDMLHPVRGTTEVEYEAEQVSAPFADTTIASPTLLAAQQMYDTLRRCRTALMPGLRNETCSVTQIVEKDDGEGNVSTETKDITQTDDCPLCFAYYCGKPFYRGSSDPCVVLPQYMVLQETTDENGDTILQTDDRLSHQVALHAVGIMQTMLSDYNAALMAGAHEVQFCAMMTQQQIYTFDFCRQYQSDGVRYLPKQLQVSINPRRELQQVTITMIKMI